MSITQLLEGYGPYEVDDLGPDEASILAECDQAEAHLDAVTVVRRLARTEAVDLSAHDLAGITVTFGDLSACD